MPTKTTKSKRKTKKVEIEEIESMEDYQRLEKLKEHQVTANCNFKNDKQEKLYKAILNNKITFVNGTAGTGKTMISLYAAIKLLFDPAYPISKIQLTKPIIEVAKSIGHLPGTVDEKTEVYYAHFYNTLYKLVGKEETKRLKSAGLIEEVILNYIRGMTFGEYDSFSNPLGYICILDEAQNITVNEMKTYISRMGENSKLVIIGDSEQSDVNFKRNEISGLDDAIQRLTDIDDIDFIEFMDEDVVRDPFLVEIMKRYGN